MNEKEIELNAAKCGVPDYMIAPIVRYLVNKIEPGSFLSAVINNDLRGAFARADDTNQYCIRNYIMFFYNHAPSGSWGYQGAVDNWINQEQD